MMNVPQLVHHYETLEYSSQESSPNTSPYKTRTQASYSSLRSNFRTMFGHRRQNSRPSSVTTDDESTSPLHSMLDSPTTLNSSPTFCSSRGSGSRHNSTSHTQHMSSLPPFTVGNLQNLMTSRRVTRKTSKPWYSRRALSQIDLALESESRAEGFENVGLGLFEPRPRRTTVSRQCTQGSVVLDGISEVLENARS